MAICTVQVTNICPKASHRQMKELFSYLGDIDEIRLFPEDEDRIDIPSKVCFVTYKERSSVETALHLSNTIFIDRAIIISQSRYEVIPDESVAMSLAAPAVAVANPALFGNSNSTPLLPTPQSSLLGTPQAPLLQNPLASAIEQAQAVATSISANLQSFDDVNNSAQNSAVLSVGGSVIPSTPTITGNVDPTKIDEIRRTIYVGNLSSTLMADQVMGFFQTCGEIRYVRMAGDETQPTRFAFVEFTNPESVQIALQYNGAMFGDRPIKVNHSKNAIVKPQGKTPEMAQREVDEAMRKVRQATHAISTAIEPGRDSRSRSRSRSRERRRSRSRDRRRRSPSRERYRRRSPSWSPRHRGHSPYRGDSRRGGYRDRRSRSRSPPRQYYSHRRRSPERDRRRRSYSKSRSPSPRRKSSRRNRDRDYEKTRERDLSATPSPSPERKKSKKSKKEKKHKKQRSPSVSLSPSPPPHEREEKVHYSDNSPLSGQDDDRHSSPSSD